MNYNNIQCPYCSRPFHEGDDIVVCPDCGTPMHRECYEKEGHCINADKHAAGFAWVRPFNPAEEEQKRLEEAQRAAAREAEQNQAGRDPGEEPFGSYNEFGTGENGEFHPTYRIIGPDEKIGSYTAREYSTVVQKNSRKYIPKFFAMEKTRRKISWNWAGFFFPVFWLAYRKMHLYAILAFLCSLLLPLCFMHKVVAYYSESYTSAASYLMSSPDSSDSTSSSDTDTAQEQPMVLTVNSYLSFAVQMLTALFGNYLYRKKCDKVLSNAASRAGPASEKEAYIAKKGGSSTWVCMAYIVGTYAVFALFYLITMKTGSDLASVIWGLFHK